MRCFFVLCLLLAIKAHGQTSYTNADSAYKYKHYKEAITLYKSGITKEIKSTDPNNSKQGEYHWMIGKCFFHLYKTDSALAYYNKALPYYRKLNDWHSVGEIRIDMCVTHIDARNLNLAWTVPSSPIAKSGEVYFKIEKLTYFDQDSVLIEINAGTNDGVINKTNAKCIGGLRKYPDRVSNVLASGIVFKVSENRTTLKFKLYNNQDTLRRVYVGDIAAVHCTFNHNMKASLLQELAAYNILFCDNYKFKLYEWRNLLQTADSLCEDDIYQKLVVDVKEVYEMIKDDRDYLELKCTDGLFKGLKMVEAMEKTNTGDIRAFLQFVQTYPGKYSGMNFTFSDVYATWIINNCPTTAMAMMDYYQSQKDENLRLNYLKNYKKEVFKNKYFTAWKTTLLKNIKQNKLNNVPGGLQLLKDAGSVYNDKNYKAWYSYCNGRYQQKLKDSATANLNFKNALSLFSEISSTEGIYLCNESLKKKTKTNQPELVLQKGHAAYYEMCFSPEGNYFITGGEDRTMKLWDAALGKEILSINAHDDEVNCVAYSSNGRYVVSASDDKTVKIWEADELKLVKTLQTGMVNRKAIISTDGNFVIVCGNGDAIQMWDIEKGRLVKKFIRHTKKVLSICWGSNENEFYSCGADSFIYHWDIDKNKTLHWYSEKDRIVNVKLSPNGKWLLSTMANGKLRIWDLDKSKGVYYFDNLRSFSYDSSSIFICEPTFSGDSKYLLYGYDHNKVVIMELVTGAGFWYHTPHYMDILSITMSDDGHQFATVGRDYLVNLYDFTDYQFDPTYNFKTIEIKGYSDIGDEIIFDNNNNILMYGNTFRKYNLSTGKDETLVNYLSSGIKTQSVFDKKRENMVAVAGDYLSVFKFNIEHRTMDTMYFSKVPIREVDYDFENDKLYVYDFNSQLHLLKSKVLVKSTAPFEEGTVIKGMFYSKDRDELFLSSYHTTKVLDGDLNHKDSLSETRDSAVYVFISASGKYYLRMGSQGTLSFIDCKTHAISKYLVIDSLKKFSAMTVAFYHHDSLLILGYDNGEVKILDWRTGKFIRHFRDHHSFVVDVAVSKDEKYFVTASIDSKVNLYNLQGREKLVTLYPFYGKGILTITDSNYYIASRNCYEGFVFKMNKQIYTPEQFDLQYHRPDLVVKKIGEAGDDIINTYSAAYLKRKQRNTTEDKSLNATLHLPQITISDKAFLPISTTQNKVMLHVEAGDILYDIKAIKVWVNNIPIYGKVGYPVASSSLVEKDLEIPLQLGSNKIKIASVNEKGVESLKEFYKIECSYKDTSQHVKTNLIVISVSNYQDATHNLTYAAKDGRDLIAAYTGKVRRLVVDSFINTSATKENILAVKSKLMKGSVNDKVIVFVSGHGILDTNYNFYFATHDMDFNHPQKRGIAYEELNDLLDGIPQRQKLLLMDACHSGEVDKDNREQKPTEVNDSLSNPLQYAQKGVVLPNQGELKLQNSFDLMQDLFSDVSSTNGAVVISAARGTGYALESSKWNNGVFTYALINGLKKLKADADEDGSVKLSELSDYIIKEVDSLTLGKQKPTSRAENLEYDWKVW